MLSRADKINCRAFVSSRVIYHLVFRNLNIRDQAIIILKDVVNGHEKLNLAFVANLFNNHPGLEPPSPEQVVNVIEETKEEKMFRYSVRVNSQLDQIPNIFGLGKCVEY